MSIDYYSCERCGNTFPDCGDYTTCNEDAGGCGRTWCSDKCAEKDGYIREYCKLGTDVNYESPLEDCEFANDSKWNRCSNCENYVGSSCSYCRNEAFEDSTLLAYALSLIGMGKEELIKDLIYNKESEK